MAAIVGVLARLRLGLPRRHLHPPPGHRRLTHPRARTPAARRPRSGRGANQVCEAPTVGCSHEYAGPRHGRRRPRWWLGRHALRAPGPGRPAAPGQEGHGAAHAHLRRPLPQDPGRLPPRRHPRRRHRRREPAHPAGHHQQRDPASTTPTWSSGWPSWWPSSPWSTPASSSPSGASRPTSARASSYDMRSKVFRHIQRMPLAFFTRTQTGALVSRLNNDVIGAQQAFTDLLSNVVGNFVTVVIVLGRHVLPQLEDHAGRPHPRPRLPHPGPLRGPAHRFADEGGVQPQQRDEHDHAGALPGGRGHAGQADGAPRVRGRLLRRQGRPGARHRHLPGHVLARLPRLAHPDGGAGHGARLRLRRRRRRPRRAAGRHPRRPDRLPDPPLRAADPALERQPRCDDRPRLLRAHLRGPRHRAHDRRGPRRGRRPAGQRLDRVRRRRLHLPERRRGLAGLARVGGGARGGPAERGPPRRLLHRRAGPHGGTGRALGSRQDDHLEPGAAPLRRDGGVGAPQRHRRAPRHHGLACATSSAW